MNDNLSTGKLVELATGAVASELGGKVPLPVGGVVPDHFSWINARSCADFSAQAYRRQGAGANFCFVDDQKTHAGALVGLLDDGIDMGNVVVAFRGSCEPVDFIQDAKFQMEDLIWPVCGDHVASVHKGFLEDFSAINEKVIEATKAALQRAGPASRIFISGHSLGGALAILCALEFRRQKLPIGGVYTFGQPRVGNKIFSLLYQTSSGIDGSTLGDITFRIVNENDIVPRTPGVLMGYRHCGQEIFLPTTGGVWVNPSIWAKLLSDGIGLYKAWKSLTDVLITEHFIEAYRERIKSE